MSSRSKSSTRAQRFWDRLVSWYGSRLTDQYGIEPKGDWCALIDAHSNDTVGAALNEIKTQHSHHPPSFPEVDAIFAKLRPQALSNGPGRVEQLHDFAVKRYGAQLTRWQLCAPWTYLTKFFDAPDSSGKIRSKHGVEITGLVIPADGDSPGIRVMVEDMALSDLNQAA
jgi:hypothetical protein